jgi:hypothetical protein
MGSSMTPRGGKREGAGRPPLYGENLKAVTVWLTQEQIEWLADRGDVSVSIRRVIMDRYDDDKEYRAATMRIDETPELEQYRDIIMYDWQEGKEHWAWIASATTRDIIEWAESIRLDEEQDKLDDEHADGQ